MHKMKMPEMDIIRFNESDVIVASGAAGKTAHIEGINYIEGDLKISLGSGATFSYLDLYGNDFSTALNKYLGEERFSSNNDVYFYVDRGSYISNTSAGELGGADLTWDWGHYNGGYTWDPSERGGTGAFVHNPQ